MSDVPRVFSNRRPRGPQDGKVVVAAPEVAARMAEQAPKHAERIYTLPDIEATTAYVIEVDAVLALPPDPFAPQRGGEQA